MEIQRAESLIETLRGEAMVYENPNSDLYDLRQVVDTPEAIDLIRSRDKAIIERCKEVCETWMRSKDGNFANMYKAIDSILRDLS